MEIAEAPGKGSSGRGPGRPRAFNRAAALAIAAETFWQLGYEGASIADLTEAMGISPQSLYAAFQSKARLYAEALDWFETEVAGFLCAALAREADVLDAFERMFLEAAQAYTTPGRPRGCMVATALIGCAVESVEVARHVAALRHERVRLFEARIARGVVEGQLRPETYAAGLAQYVAAVLQGMAVQARDGATLPDLLVLGQLAMAALIRHKA